MNKVKMNSSNNNNMQINNLTLERPKYYHLYCGDYLASDIQTI